jgi:large subunit ribosomal protein L9
MEIILVRDVAGFGRKGEVKNVKPGYYRNFLLPRRLAQIATDNRLRVADKIRAKALIKLEELEKMALNVKEKLDSLTLEFKRKVTSKNKLYGALKAKDLIEAIKKEAKVELKPEYLILEEAIKTPGEHSVMIKLTDKIQFPIKVNLIAEK